ncbi:MAG: TIGR04086 family membrane protein [Clostridia bacterium]|nr:TIGR04086 family membrane protein [Clostridia bacterium]
MKTKAIKTEKIGFTTSVLKGSLIGVAVALVSILLFAFVLRFTNVSDTIITPVNQVIKGVSIFFGVFLGIRGHKQNGLIKGSLIGLGFTIVAFLTFSLLDGAFVFDKTFFNDIVFGMIIGAICGIICVNLKKN